MEAFWRFLGIPVPLAAVTTALLHEFADVNYSFAVFLVVWCAWIVIINGGVLILDEDVFS